jgi:hypothetical protein
MLADGVIDSHPVVDKICGLLVVLRVCWNIRSLLTYELIRRGNADVDARIEMNMSAMGESIRCRPKPMLQPLRCLGSRLAPGQKEYQKGVLFDRKRCFLDLLVRRMVHSGLEDVVGGE